MYVSLKRPVAPASQTVGLLAGAGAVLAVVALGGRVGADARWLAALGHLIVTHHSIPAGIPFAPRASSHWPNVPVLAELIFNGLETLMGDRGLVLAQIAAVGFALAVLARDSAAGGAEPAATGRALVLAGVGSLGALLIARAQLFSLALFPVLCWLVRSEARRPSWRIWLSVPLLALWSNVHGGALVGLGVLGAYLLLCRARQRPVQSIAVGLAGTVALCATPALADTPAYYFGVLSGPMTASGQGMWAPLSLASPLDALFILCAVVLSVQFARARPALWERLTVVGLALLSAQAARNGVWLVLFLVPGAARAFAPQPRWRAVISVAAVLSLTLLTFALARGPVPFGADPAVVTRAISLAHGSPVLAADVIEEQVALAGGSIAVGDPIDAFPARDQRAYLRWLEGQPGSLGSLDAGVRVVLVTRGTPAARLMASQRRYAVAGRDGQTVLYTLVTRPLCSPGSRALAAAGLRPL